MKILIEWRNVCEFTRGTCPGMRHCLLAPCFGFTRDVVNTINARADATFYRLSNKIKSAYDDYKEDAWERCSKRLNNEYIALTSPGAVNPYKKGVNTLMLDGALSGPDYKNVLASLFKQYKAALIRAMIDDIRVEKAKHDKPARARVATRGIETLIDMNDMDADTMETYDNQVALRDTSVYNAREGTEADYSPQATPLDALAMEEFADEQKREEQWKEFERRMLLLAKHSPHKAISVVAQYWGASLEEIRGVIYPAIRRGTLRDLNKSRLPREKWREPDVLYYLIEYFTGMSMKVNARRMKVEHPEETYSLSIVKQYHAQALDNLRANAYA